MDPDGYQQRSYITQQQPQQQQQQGQYGGYGAPQAAGPYGQPPPSGFAPSLQQPQAALIPQGQPYDPQQTTQYSGYGGAPLLGQQYAPPLQPQGGAGASFAAPQQAGQQLYAGDRGGSFPGDQGAPRYASGGGGGSTGRAATTPYAGQALMAPPLAAAPPQAQGAVGQYPGQYPGQYQAAPGGQYLAPQPLQGAPHYGGQAGGQSVAQQQPQQGGYGQSVAQQQPQQGAHGAASSHLQGSLGGGGGYASLQAAQGPGYTQGPGALAAAPYLQPQQGGDGQAMYGAPQQQQQQQQAADFACAPYDPRKPAAAAAPVLQHLQQALQYHQQQYQPVYAHQEPSAAYAPVAASAGGQHATQHRSGGLAYAAQPPPQQQQQRGRHPQQAQQQQYVQYAAVPAADVAGSRYEKGERGVRGRGGKTKRAEPANARVSTHQPPPYSAPAAAAAGRRDAPAGGGGGRGREQQRWEAAAPVERAKHPQKQQKPHAQEKRPPKPAPAKSAAPAKARRQSPAPAKLPPPPPYGVRAPSRPLGATPTIEYLEVERRHDRLHMAHDFSRLVGCWAAKGPPPLSDSGLGPLCRILDLTAHMPTVHEVAPQATEGALVEYDVAPPSSALPGGTVYNAKVVLLNGISPEERAAALLEGDPEALARRIRLVVARAEKVGAKKERTGIFALGGRFDPALDGGGDPARDDAPLIAAATRHVSCQVGIDLAPCSRWVRFAEVQYSRLDRRFAAHHKEVTVLFLVADATAALLPSAQEWPAVWAAQQAAKAAAGNAAAEDMTKSAAAGAVGASSAPKPTAAAAEEEEAEKEEEEGELPAEADTAAADGGAAHASAAGVAAPAEAVPPRYVLLRGVHNRRVRLKTMSISLDGLLDYDESDKEEGTFELSLFAEQFQEMVCRDSGDAILRELLARRSAALAAEAVPKRKAEQLEATAGAGAAADVAGEAAKRVKTEAEDASAAAAAAVPVLPAVEPVATKEEPDSLAEGIKGEQGEGGAAPEEAQAAAADIQSGQAHAEVEVEVEVEVEAEEAAPGSCEVEDIIMLDDEPPAAAAPVDEPPAEGAASPAAAAGAGAAPPAAPAVLPAGELVEQRQRVEERPAAKPVASAAGATATAAAAHEPPARTAVDEALLLSFRYFDSTGAGWFKGADLRALIESLGRGLNHAEAKELVGVVVEVPGRKQERVKYRELCTKKVAAGPTPAPTVAAAVGEAVDVEKETEGSLP